MRHRRRMTPVCRWIFHRFIPDGDRESFNTAISEVYDTIFEDRGKVRAFIWIWVQLLKSLPCFIRHHIVWSLAMISNYIKIAIRNVKRHAACSLINVVGLAVGMACCLLILLWVVDELCYDRFHEHAEHIYRVLESERMSSGRVMTYSVVPPALAPTLKSNYPEVVEAARFKTLGSRVIQSGDRRFYEDGFAFIDPEFFGLFSFSFIEGDARSALNDPSAIIITQEMAEKFFGNEAAMGKTIRVDGRLDFRVSAIIQNIPHQSHIQFQFGVLFDNLKRFNREVEGWRTYAYHTYLLLKDGSDIPAFETKIENLIINNNKGAIATLSVQPITQIHLFSAGINGMGGTGDIRYVVMFSIVACFILIMACINFMNLTTARAGKRAREVGLRKVIGAGRGQLIRQFLGESLFMTLLALAVALALVFMVLPGFRSLTGKPISMDPAMHSWILFGAFGIAVLTGLLAGSYPALMLSAFKPVMMLSAKQRSCARNPGFRKILVIIQFVITIMLIAGTSILYKQMQFLRRSRLGYDKENILYMELKGDLNERYPVLGNQIMQLAGVLNVCGVSDLPVGFRMGMLVTEWEGHTGDDRFLIDILYVDENYLETFGMGMAEGRFFQKEFATGDSNAVIVNQAAVRAMGMEAPVGKRIEDATIVGVVKDFHTESLHHAIAPVVIGYEPSESRYLIVKIRPGQSEPSIRSIGDAWRQFAPDFPFEYHFLDERIERMYQGDIRVGRIFQTFTGLAILIACLGLFGLSSFMAEQRTKEIGIRKVLGAGEGKVLLMLNTEFLKCIVAANLIACPVAYFIMRRLLMAYAYRIALTLGFFLFSAGIALVITLFTVSFQSVRAARANPADALRYE